MRTRGGRAEAKHEKVLREANLPAAVAAPAAPDASTQLTEDSFNALMWAGFAAAAWRDPEARAAFTRATGVPLPSEQQTPIERAIDQVTGLADEAAAKFLEWFTVEQWGLAYAPLAYQQQLKAVRR
jgi:hypothetical protein